MVIIKSKMSASKAQVIANKWSAAPREAYARMLGALTKTPTQLIIKRI